jgi:hypothetical protein
VTIAAETSKQQQHQHADTASPQADGSSHDANAKTQTKFTTAGTIPPVATGGGEAPMSASDRAFGYVTADALNVRRAPEKGDNVIGGLEHGAKVETKGTHGSWLEIEHGPTKAFVHGTFVHVDGKPQAQHDHTAHGETPAPQVGATPPVAGPEVHQTAHGQTPAPQHVGAPVAGPEVKHADTAPPTNTSPLGRTTTPTPPPAQTTTRPPTTPTTATPHAIKHQDAETFETIQHTRVEVNTDDEGKALSEIRASAQQFDPTWLIEIQKKLQVGDATGAFNTETLRAIRDHANNQKLTGKQIASEKFLVDLGKELGIAGAPLRTKVTGIGTETADTSQTFPADIAAQSVGYVDFKHYRAETMKVTKFLDQDMTGDGRAHPVLKSRLEAAEAYLVARFGSKEKAIQGTGWSGKANLSYADEVEADAHNEEKPMSHMHTMGMAIDIDPNVNPYTMPKGDGTQADWRYWFYTTGWQMGNRLGFGGDELDLDSLYAEGTKMSSEELHEHMLASSKSFAQVVELSEKSDDEIKTLLEAAGYKDGKGKNDIPNLLRDWFHSAKSMYHDKKGGRKFHETMTESKELIVALRDAGGLNWGGTEMSKGQNGDFMHFDTRNDATGKTVYDAGYKAQKAWHKEHDPEIEAKKAAAKAEAEAKKKDHEKK